MEPRPTPLALSSSKPAARCHRREFLKLGAAAATLPLLGQFAWSSILSDEHTAWYRDAKYGMFIHWGHTRRRAWKPHGRSWCRKPGGITQAEYVELPKRFNPATFDARALVDLARSAGQRYMVLTTKHHDGFCMFDSNYTDYKITKTPYGEDIVAQLAAAAQEAKEEELPVVGDVHDHQQHLGL